MNFDIQPLMQPCSGDPGSDIAPGTRTRAARNTSREKDRCLVSRDPLPDGRSVPSPQTLKTTFSHPSFEFGPVPFWWWVGEPLDRGRLEWQLDRLLEKGVRNAIVSYNHHGDGSPNRGEPAVFSAEWWDLMRYMLEACQRRGMQLSFQDYTLLNPTLEEIGGAEPGMAGSGTLREANARVSGGGAVTIQAEGGVVAAFAYPLRSGRADAGGALDLNGAVRGGVLKWQAPAGDGEWLVVLMWCRSSAFDPLHPDSGALAIGRFYAPFEREVGGHLGRTLSISFQDELDFGAGMPRWSRVLPVEFQARKGYALLPVLAALWHDLGAPTPKVRIDYADVVVRLLEERYFIPVFEWHERHGLLFGNDNIGRGGIEAGRQVYGDAFRTMRWYSAPGTDDPSLAGARAFRGLKVNSSIAHLYRRPRVWNECFHSSGWGTLPGDVVAALNADFVLGATVVNLHGLYYSTFGGWWEWAPPDFHFRQPYWDDTEALAGYATRLCQALSQGVHVCDVAIVYPITALEGGLNPLVDASEEFDLPVSERQAGNAGATLDAAEASAFGIGRRLLESGVDFDFVDFESLERAGVCDGGLRVAGEAYRVLVLPWMSAVRFSTLCVARDFMRSGGLVIFYGCKPTASERAGAEDAELDALVAELCGPQAGGVFLPGGFQAVLEEVVRHAGRDFDPSATGFQAVHRRAGETDLYFVFNPAREEVAGEVGFRASGRAVRMDAWTGETHPLASERVSAELSRIALRLGPGEGALVAFEGAPEGDVPKTFVPLPPEVEMEALDLSDRWEVELEPTMDNRFGDFRRPPGPVCLGAEARRFRHAPEGEGGAVGWEKRDFDDARWSEVTFSFGQKLWCLGPLPPGPELEAMVGGLASAGAIDPERAVSLGGSKFSWRPYAFSTRWGVENDPHLMDWSAGPHGLKGKVPDEFIDLHTGTPGAIWLLWTAVEVAEARTATFTMGSRSRYAAWLNGRRVLEQDSELPPGRQSIWNLPHYRCEPQENEVALHAGANPLLLRFVQPEGQRMRAFAAFAPPPLSPVPELALRWFAAPGHPLLNPCPQEPARASWYRFQPAPGLRTLRVVARAACSAWADGAALALVASERRSDGVIESRFALGGPPPSRVALRVEPVRGAFGGDSLVEPVGMECGPGELRAGDWCGQGLAHYSGRAWYRQTLSLSPWQARNAICLDLGGVAATAGIWVNGRKLATLIAPPWRVPVEGVLQAGKNRIEIRVANTLANHFHAGIPTPYAPAGQTVSGLLGPVQLYLKKS